MSEKMKKVDVKTELTDDELEQVAGGYSAETWSKMTKEERRRAREESQAYNILNMYCAIDDPNA